MSKDFGSLVIFAFKRSCRFIYLSLYPSIVCLSVHLPSYLSIYLSIFRFINLSVYLYALPCADI